MKTEYKYLGGIRSPEDVKRLRDEEIGPLCSEIRDCIANVTRENGGHLASNLGVVELSVAIHRVFESPKDHIIFDVGHQSYTHKLLTGRYQRFDSLRCVGGLSGFTNRTESEHDCFGAGHSSTSLSAALGFAEADRLSGSDAYTIVVLGDGAFTGGMIHEALNNCNKDLKKLIIILNENEMSISKNIGRFAASIAKLRKKNGYFKVKRFTVSFIKKIPFIGNGIFKGIRQIKKSVKNALYGSTYFEDLGLYYLGPADGNDYSAVEALLKAAKSAGENVLVHLKTQKGKGYGPAEKEPSTYHGITPSNKIKPTMTYSKKLGECLCSLADNDGRICAITAAMSTGTGLDPFAEKHKNRFFDVGIAEEHAVTFAAGLAANGQIPVFAVYSTFLQRAYDQIIHDVALQKLPVVFAIDRAGINNSDGATHHGIFDVAFLSQIPDVEIYTPVTFKGLEMSLKKAVESRKTAAIRYPNGCEDSDVLNTFYLSDKDDVIGVKTDFASQKAPESIIITHGRIISECLKAKETLSQDGIQIGIVLCEYIAPYERLCDEIWNVLSEKLPERILFVEEEIKSGGFGMNLSEKMRKKLSKNGIKYDIVAMNDPFVACKEGQTYNQVAGVDSESISIAIKKLKNND